MELMEQFEANGRKYKVTTSLSVERWTEFEIAQIEMGFGVTFSDMVRALNKIYADANKGKLADVAVTAYNTLQGIKTRIEDRTHPVLKICALFINYEGEDAGKWDEDIAKEKQNDWKAAGMPMDYFFRFALNAVENLLPVYAEISRSTSKFMEKLCEVMTTSETSD